MKLTGPLVFAAVMLCFFISGVAGLVYQIVWARYLALFLGHTSYAVVAVLVAFMGGLALGNAWFGIRADRSRTPLAFYGWLEIGIAIYAILFPTYYQLCHDLFVALARQWEPGSQVLLGLKFGFSFLTILVPTFLMGATFPVLTKFVTRALAELRERVAALYCINSTGAAAGCLIADFWWIPSIGLEMTVFAGAALNLVAGVIALYLSKSIQEGQGRATDSPEETARPGEERFSSRELRLAIVGIGLSGFVAMLYEVVWTRLLGLALGSSTHAFSIMLVTFISGIAAGAWVIYRWKSLRRTMEAFAWAEIALAGTLFLSMFFYEYLPYWFLQLSSLLARSESSYVIYQFLQGLICFLVMFIPSVCLGMTLPLVSRIATAELARTGRSVGKVFAVNTLGTVLGAIVTGLWLMPWLGLARTFAVGITLNALVGMSLLLRHRLRISNVAALLLGGLALFWLSGVIFNERWQQVFSLGLWRNRVPPPSVQHYREMARADEILYYKDGAGATVSIIKQKTGNKEVLGLKVNGKADASTGFDVPTQLLSGHVPMMLRPASKDILVIGLGSAMTCSAALRHPTVERVDAVEISQEVAEAARWFGPYNDHVLDNPKLNLIVDDAKSFLKISDRQYDLIISEPSNPWMAGVSGVFSLEYYEQCRDRLKPGGMMAQWVQIYETSDATLNVVLATFGSVFPYLSIWHSTTGDFILAGSVEPVTVNMEEMEARYNHPQVKADMERMNITQFHSFLARQIVSQENGAFIPPPESKIHSDFFPVLEYYAQKAFFVREVAAYWRNFDETFSPRPGTWLAQYMKTRAWTEADFRSIGQYYLDHRLPQPETLRSLIVRWQKEHPTATLPIELMTLCSDGVLAAELEALRLAPLADFLLEHAGQDSEPLRLYASYVMQTYRAHRSVFYVPPADFLETMLQRLIETNPSNQRVYKLHLAELAWDRGEDSRCLELGQNAFDPDFMKGGRIDFSIDPKAPQIVLARMIESLWRGGKLAEAWSLCQDARANRYLGKDPVLDMVYRKVEAYAGILSGPAAP